MEIPDTKHEQALSVESAAAADSKGTDYSAAYWLALACCLLTSSVRAEREKGKMLVRRWKKRIEEHPKE